MQKGMRTRTSGKWQTGKDTWARAKEQGWMGDGKLARVIGQGKMGTANGQGQEGTIKWTAAEKREQMGKGTLAEAHG